MKVRDLIKKVEEEGWRYMYSVGSHKHFKHPTLAGKVTIPGHPGDDVTPGTLRSVLKQAGLK